MIGASSTAHKAPVPGPLLLDSAKSETRDAGGTQSIENSFPSLGDLVTLFLRIGDVIALRPVHFLPFLVTW